MDKLEHKETAAEKAARLLHAEIERSGEKTILKRQRTLEILAENHQFTCTLDLDISFEQVREDGTALNKAEIFLLPEEYPAFFLALSEHRLPLPTDYRQWQTPRSLVSAWKQPNRLNTLRNAFRPRLQLLENEWE